MSQMLAPLSFKWRPREWIRVWRGTGDIEHEVQNWFSLHPQCAFNVFDIRVGPVASGASVLQNSDAVQRILGDHKDLLGVEMEIFSVMFAAHVAPAPRPVAIALKSVCDFGDEEKHDDYQKYAAYTSAQVLWKMIERMVGG